MKINLDYSDLSFSMTILLVVLVALGLFGMPLLDLISFALGWTITHLVLNHISTTRALKKKEEQNVH